MTNMVIKLFGIAVVLTTIGCVRSVAGGSAQAGGSSLSSAQLRGYGVSLLTVNGSKIGGMDSVVTVPAGTVDVEFVVDRSNFNTLNDAKRLQLSFPAVAEGEYVITARRGDRRLCAWVVNPDSGEPDWERPAGCIKR